MDAASGAVDEPVAWQQQTVRLRLLLTRAHLIGALDRDAVLGSNAPTAFCTWARSEASERK